MNELLAQFGLRPDLVPQPEPFEWLPLPEFIDFEPVIEVGPFWVMVFMLAFAAWLGMTRRGEVK